MSYRRDMQSAFQPLVTIAIPTYNRAHLYLRDAIAGALGQSYSNIEVVVSDNCSTDNTEQLVKEFRDPRLRYFRQSVNIGANNNFNYCLEQARGEYFHLLLDDDHIDPDFIEVCVKAASSQPEAGIIRTGTRIIDETDKVRLERRNQAAGLSMTDFLLAWFSNKTTLYLCSTLFNTAHLRTIGGLGSRHNLFQDVMAEIKLAARFGRVDVSDVKAGFRTHGENMGSSAKVIHWCEDSLDLHEIICNAVPEHDREMIRREGMRFLCWMNYKRAQAVTPFTRKFITYIAVGRMFNFAYPLRSFLSKEELRPSLRAWKARFSAL
jgi:glycosyltransferase involved in cell wall biosynthesis